MGRRRPFLFLCVVIAILAVFCCSRCANGEDIQTSEADSGDEGDEVQVSTDEFDDEDLDAFVPTSQWQTVAENQAIPAGLHIRMNLATGLKEAKLLEPEDGVKQTEMIEINEKHQLPGNDEVSVDRGQRRGIINTKRIPFTVKQAREALAKIKDESTTDSSDVDINSLPPALPDQSQEKQKLTVQEMEQVLEVLGLKMRSEVEIMALQIDILTNASSTDEQRVNALNELEYYVHQIDNARDLNTIGGLVVVVQCLNDSSADIRGAAALVLGAAAQSNEQVQSDCLEYNTLQLLLERVRIEGDGRTKKRLVFAVSSLVRQFHPAQKELVKLGGVSALTHLLNGSECEENEGACQQLSLKALTLVTDLLVEHSSKGVLTAQSKITSGFGVELLSQLVSNGWCSLVPRLLKPEDFDVSEKVLQAMQMLVHACGNEFASHDIIDQLSVIARQWKGLASESRDQYYESLVELTSQFLEQIVDCQNSGRCLL